MVNTAKQHTTAHQNFRRCYPSIPLQATLTETSPLLRFSLDRTPDDVGGELRM